MGCQRDIARKIRDQRPITSCPEGQPGHVARRCLGLRGRQRPNVFKHATISRDETVDGDHGRIETRATTVIHDLGGCASATPGRLERPRHHPQHPRDRWHDRTRDAPLCHLTELPGQEHVRHRANPFALENSLHWVLDMRLPRLTYAGSEPSMLSPSSPPSSTSHSTDPPSPRQRLPTLNRILLTWDDDYLL